MVDAIVLLVALIPSLAWLFFYLKEDCHPEPFRLIALTFVLGAGSAFVAYLVQVPFSSWLNPERLLTDISPRPLIGLLLILAAIEELAKFGAAYLAVHKSPEFDEPIDAMIYSVVAALGFATVENLGAIGGGGMPTGTTPLALTLQIVFQTASLRFVGATLLHTLTSAIIGYHWAEAIRTFNHARHLVIGIVLAILLHAAFNYFIITFGSLSYSLVFIVLIGFFVLSDFEAFRQKTV